MIIVSISGGPGNQFFQYAAGKYLSDRLNSRLVLDYSWYESKASRATAKREFVLDELLHDNAYDLAVSGPLAKTLRLSLMLGHKLAPHINRYRYTRLDEINPFCFDLRFDVVSGNVFINGFWQAWKYSSNIEGNILSSQFIENCIRHVDTNLLAAIKQPNSICVSVRRGSDYDKNLLVCDEDWYSLSINKISDYLSKHSLDPSVFVFSDNIEWCKQRLRIEPSLSVTFVEKFNGIEKWKTDLYLGAQCAHHILSNSSFSWWVAAINRHENKKVQKYVAVPGFWWSFIPVDNIDIYPNEWHVIKSSV